MKNNKYYTRLASILSIINENAMSSREELQRSCNEAIYAELWLAVQGFINYYVLCSKSHFNSNGERVEGNASKVRRLISYGIELEDIRGNILIHVLCKMDHILAQPIEKQINYIYRMINNCIYDEFRKLPPAGVVVVSLHDKVRGNNISSENISEFQDFISDPNTPEDEIVAKEIVNKIFLTKRTEILNEISLLANKPAEVFVCLSSKHLDMKPAAIASILFKKGIPASFATVLMSVSDKFNIPLSEIRNRLANEVITEESVKLNTNDESKVSAQISRLVYRAGKRLNQ